MSMYDVYEGQVKNRVDIINKRVDDLMFTVKQHPSMKAYSPAVRKKAKQEIAELLRYRLDTYDLKITPEAVYKWLDNYTPYAQASTTAYIKRVAKEKGYETFSPAQVDYVKEALLKSMEPEEYFSFEAAAKGKPEVVRIPLHGKALGTERDLAAKVATHVDWAVKKTVKNILTPEGVTEFLAKHEKDLPQPIDKKDFSSYVDNIIMEAKSYLYKSDDKKITPKTIANIDNELFFAVLNANLEAKDFKGALFKKLGTSTFVDNDKRLALIKNALDNKIGERGKSERDRDDYVELRDLMERFFKAVRWSMKYKTGKFDTSTYSAVNHYPKVELAIREFVANSPLSAQELSERFRKIFNSNDNPEAIDRLYMPDVFNPWWTHVSRTLGLDEKVSTEILTDFISDKTVDYVEWNKTNFERDLDKENEMKKSFMTDKLKSVLRGNLTNKVEANKKRAEELLKFYYDDKKQKPKDRQRAKDVKRMDKREKKMVINKGIDVLPFDDDLDKLARGARRDIQKTTSRLKIDVISKAENGGKGTRDFILYRAKKRIRHTELVNKIVESFITDASLSLDEWEKEAKENVEKEYNDKLRERESEPDYDKFVVTMDRFKKEQIARIDRLKAKGNSRIKKRASNMKATALETFHDAVYEKKEKKEEKKEGTSDGKEN